MYKKLFLFALLVLPFLTQAQDANAIIEKLKMELKNNPDSKRTASIYSDLTWYYANISSDSALAYGQKAIVETTKLKDSTLLAQIYSDLGAVHFRRADYAFSKKNYLTAYNIRKLRNDKVGMAKVSANLANIYNKENKKALALKSYLEAVDYFEKINNLEAAALTNANIGVLFNDLKNYSKSMKYTKKALDYQEANNKQDGLATSYLTMGNIYLKLKDTTSALKYYNKSRIVSKSIGNNVSLSSALNNISKIKSDQNKMKEVDSLLKQSKAIRTQLNASKDDSNLSLSFVDKYLSTGKINEAKTLLLQLKKDYGNNATYRAELLQTYGYLSVVYSYLKVPDSTNYYNNLSMDLQDKVIEETVQKQTNELESKYQTEKKEKLLLEKEIQIKNTRNSLIGVALLAIFIGLIGFLIYRQQKLKNKQQEQEFQLKSAIKEIESQNQLHEQRLTISRDLHDNIGAQLTFVISSVDNLKFGNQIVDTKINNQLTKISDFTKSTIVELRDTIWAMNTNEFTFEDLRSRIFNFIEKAKSAKEDINFKFYVDENLKDVKFSSIIGINLYRTMQEAVNNAVKYADAKEIDVTIATQNNQTKIEIKDNGNGFDSESIDYGNGLYNMQKRIEEVGGKLEITSALNKGTTISILLSKN